jgi:hypothetical protein
MKDELAFVSLCHMLLPAFLVHIDSTFGAAIDSNPGFFATDRKFHDLLPPLFFLLEPSEPVPFPPSALESVT